MQQFIAQHPALYVAGSTLFFLLVSIVAMAGVALTSGWSSLAERYRTEREFPSHMRSLQRAQMRWRTNYNNILRLGSDSEGLYLAMPSLLRFSHPTLFVPWRDVRVDAPRQMLWMQTQNFALGSDAIPLRMREPLAKFLLEPRTASPVDRLGAVSSTF